MATRGTAVVAALCWLVGRLGLQVRNIDVAKINYLPAVKASIFDTSIISHCITDLSGAQVLIQT